MGEAQVLKSYVQVPSTGHSTHHFVFAEDWDNVELNELGWQHLECQNSWLVGAHTRVYSDLHKAEKEKRTKKQSELTALNRKGTQHLRPESPSITPPGMRVNRR